MTNAIINRRSHLTRNFYTVSSLKDAINGNPNNEIILPHKREERVVFDCMMICSMVGRTIWKKNVHTDV